MSLKAIVWALEHADCPSPAAKLVLIALANHVDVTGRVWVAATTIAAVTKLDIKTVRGAIDAMEGRLILDTGARRGRTAQVKVYQLVMESHPETDSFDDDVPESPQARVQSVNSRAPRRSIPKTDGLKTTVFPGKATQKREGEPVTEPSPPIEPEGSMPPGGGRRRGKSIPSDWTPPAIDALPERARAIAAQWPAGAYATEAEAWRSARIASGRGARDWPAAWAAHVVAIGAKPLRDARAGVRHDCSPVSPPSATPAPIDYAVDDAGEPLTRWRHAVALRVGPGAYRHWLAGAKARIVNDTVELCASSAFAASHIQAELLGHLERAALAELHLPRVAVTSG